MASIERELTTTENLQSESKSSLRPRRTLNRLALALAGVLAAALGQFFFSRESLWDGLLLYGAAIILFNIALLDRVFPKRDLSPFKDSLGVSDGWRRRVGVWLILIGVGISFLAFDLFADDVAARLPAWWLYLASLALLVGGGLLLAKGSHWRSELRHLLPRRYVTLGLVLVMILALFMRLYNFYEQPFGIWYDEAEAGLLARRMLEDPSYRPIFFPSPINHPIYLPGAYALALAWFGNTIYSMRLVSVLFGLGGVVAAYLFGRELRGPRFGLALAFLMAVSRWPVNFSRIAMTGIDTPFFEFLSLFFLVRLLKRGHLRDAFWSGLTLGVGLMVYTGFRLYVLALLIFAVVFALGRQQWVINAWEDGTWRAHLGRLALMGLTIWLIFMPVARFALDNPDEFLFRTRQISIFNKRDEPDLGKALWASTRKHLLMFNFQGDRNGRHNLPGEPILDPAMGLLAVLGFGLALFRPRRPANGFFLILFPLGLAGGILSVDFEAPHSLRSIAVMPSIFYFAGLAIAALGREAEAVFKPLSRFWLLGPAAAVAAFMVFHNATSYFGRQADDFPAWNAFSTPETIIGRKMAELGPRHRYYLSPLLMGHPTSRFLAPNVDDRQALPLPDALPIREPADRPVTLFIHTDNRWVVDRARRLYPEAEFETIFGPGGDETGGQPAVYIITLQPNDLASVQGLDLVYRPNDPARWPPEAEPDRPPLETRRVPTIQIRWPDEAPVESDFVAEWQGVLYAPEYGPYTFRLTTPGAGRLEIDGNLLLEGEGKQSVSLPLARGDHALRVQAQAGMGEVALSWQPPGQKEMMVPQWALYAPPLTNHGLLGTFYANDQWAGQPALQRIDPFLDTYFHLLPLRRPYTVEWEGVVEAPQTGLYQFSLRAVTEAQLFLDDQLLISTTQPNEFETGGLTLEAGLHDIRVRFKDDMDRSRIHLFWATPAGSFEPIPSENLWPPMGSYPERPTVEPPAQVASLELNWLTTLGGPGAAPSQFFEPRDVAVLSNGSVVIADTANRRVQILDFQGNPLHMLIGDEFPFEEPLAVGVNSRDEILVLDSTLQWIYRYDASGTFIERFGGPEAFLFHPRGLTVFQDDTVAVADTGTSHLTLFSADGRRMATIGEVGSAPGQLNEPTDVLRDDQGTYFVVEAMNNRIQRLDAAGSPLNEWSIPPAHAFNGPHLAFGPDGSIFMTEAQSHSLLRYAPDGTLLDQRQVIGPISLNTPVGIYFDQRTNRLYITDVQSHEVHIFEVRITGQ